MWINEVSYYRKIHKGYKSFLRVVEKIEVIMFGKPNLVLHAFLAVIHLHLSINF